MNKLLTPLLLILFTLPSFASDLPPCPKGTYHNCFGTYTYDSGNKYVGEFKDRKRHGKGTYTWADGDKYVGEFKNNKLHGKGTYTWPDGDKYVGEFKNNKLHGKGTKFFANGDKYVGEFKNNELHGKGTKFFANGGKYVGEWKDGMSYSPKDKARDKAREEIRSRASCARDAGKAGTEYAAKQIEKTCLEDFGLKPKGWFDW